jgi:chemotaxis protein CheD
MNPSQKVGPRIIYLPSKRIHFTTKANLVITVPGSCVAITMFNSRLTVAAICHSLLPDCLNYKKIYNRSSHERFKYVNYSISWMAEKISSYGIKPSEIEVKLFGGADMATWRDPRGIIRTIGSVNVRMALKTIEDEGLKLVASNVGETCGRKIYFYTHTGEVFLKRL